MKLKLWAVFFLFFLFFPHHRSDAEEVFLEITPGGFFDVKYALSNGLSTVARLQISGDLTVDFKLDHEAFSSLRFLGGNIAYANTSSDLVISSFPAPTQITLKTENIVSSLKSGATAGMVDPLSGVISNRGHHHIQDRGLITTQYFLLGSLAREEVRDLEHDPDKSSLVGTTTMALSKIQNLGYKELYRIEMNHSRDENRTQPVTVIDGSLTIEEKGSFQASGEIWRLGQDFIDWCLGERGKVPESYLDRCDLTDQPLALLFAFDARSGPWVPPVSFDPTAPRIQIQLPANGLQAPVRVEYQSSLETGQWNALLQSDGSPAVLEKGLSDSVFLELPPGLRGFIRLALPESVPPR